MKFIFSARFIVGFFTGVMSLVLVFVALLLRGGDDKMAVPFVPNEVDAVYDWPLKNLGGDEFDFSTLKGKTVFLTAWNPKCHNCIAELPYLQSLYERIQDDDIEFVTVTFKHSDETVDEVLDLMAEYDLTFPIYMDEVEADRPLVYNPGQTPATFVISPDGKVAFRWMGPARWDDESFISYLRGLSIMGQNPIADEITD
jgi:peroxiredoxin